MSLISLSLSLRVSQKKQRERESFERESFLSVNHHTRQGHWWYWWVLYVKPITACVLCTKHAFLCWDASPVLALVFFFLYLCSTGNRTHSISENDYTFSFYFWFRVSLSCDLSASASCVTRTKSVCPRASLTVLFDSKISELGGGGTPL